jgi:hypothetical protein
MKHDGTKFLYFLDFLSGYTFLKRRIGAEWE